MKTKILTSSQSMVMLFACAMFLSFGAKAVTPVYVDDDFPNPVLGQDPDGAGPATEFGTDSFATVQEGIDAATSGGVVYVAAGTYVENVNVNKALTLSGANAGSSGCGARGSESLINGGFGTALTISADDVTVDGFALQGVTGVQAYGYEGFSIENNVVTAGAAGIDVRNVLGTGTPSFTVENNKVILTAKEVLGNATAGIILAGIGGTGPDVGDNCVTNAFGGYGLFAVNTTPTFSVSGGEVSGALQGVVVLNADLTGTNFAPSSFVIEGLNLFAFSGSTTNPARNFHAGVYVFTGGTNTSATISGTISNVTVSGTEKPGADSAALYFADFSTGVGLRQNISVVNCVLQDNENRGIYARGTNASVSVTGSVISGNGFDPFSTGGNFGYGIISVGVAVTVTESFIANPASSSDNVFGLLVGGAGSLVVSNCSINNNGNPSGYLASGAMIASNNWWGTAKGPTHSSNPGGNAGSLVGSVVFSPWLGDGTDTSGAAGFQPNASPIYYRPVNLAVVTQPGGAVTNSPLSPQPEIEALNEIGGRALQFTEPVTLAIANNPSSGTLSGTNPENAAAGLASFADLSINNAGFGYTLQATSPGLTPVTTAAFDVHTAVVITSQPDNVSVGAGTNAVFTVVASGTSVVYQWKKNGIDLVDGGNVSGATGASLTLSAATQSDASTNYTVVVSNAQSSATSVAVSLSVVDPPTILSGPLSRTNLAGTTASFAVVADGTGPFNYRWRFNGVDIPDETFTNLSVLAVQESNAGNYTVVITNAAGAVTSAPAVLTVHYALSASATLGGSVVVDPVQSSYAPNASVELTAVVETGFEFVGWSGDASGMSNPLNVTMDGHKNITAMFMGPGGEIVIDNDDALGRAEFEGFWFTLSFIKPHYGVDYRYTSPGTNEVTARATYRPEIVRPGNYDVYLFYPQRPILRTTNAQWLVSHDGGSVLLGVDQHTNGGRWHLIAADKPFVPGTNQFVRVSNDTGETETNAYVMADAVRFVYSANQGVAPTFLTEPVSQNVNQTSNVTFTVSASGNGTLAYQWRFNNEPIAGATGTSYTRTNVQPSHVGNYAVVVIHDDGSAISSNAVLSVNEPPVITLPPANRTLIAGQSHTFTVAAVGTGPLSYQWQFNSNDISGATSTSYALSNVTAANEGHYRVIVSNVAEVVATANAYLTVNPDLVNPSISYTYPLVGGRVGSANITMTGRAKDNIGVAEVKYIFEGVTNTATGTTMWAAPLTLAPGTNVVVAWSVDYSGNASPLRTNRFYYNSTNFLSLTINGNGQVRGLTNGQGLLVGRPYTATAHVGAGTNWVFTNWSGSVSSTNKTLTFLMQSNMTLVANFITNPFTPVAGKYHGLFSDTTNGVSHQSAGFFLVNLTQKSGYSARVVFDGNSLAFSGKFDLGGTTTRTISRAKLGKSPLTVTLNIDWATTNETISGTLTDGNWSSAMLADRAIYHAIHNPTTNFLGRYTLLVPPTNGPVTAPGGYGYALVTNTVGGIVRISGGALGDGAIISQSVPMSKFGHWPFYARAYKQVRTFYTNDFVVTTNLHEPRGMVMGWITFTNNPARTLVGTLHWVKSAIDPTNTFYAGGFTNEVELLASEYTAPLTGYRLLDITNGTVLLDNGNFVLPSTNTIFIRTNNLVTTVTSDDTLKMSFNLKTGLMKGSFIHPDNTNKLTSFWGTVLQDQNIGAGYFLGYDQSGSVRLESAD